MDQIKSDNSADSHNSVTPAEISMLKNNEILIPECCLLLGKELLNSAAGLNVKIWNKSRLLILCVYTVQGMSFTTPWFLHKRGNLSIKMSMYKLNAAMIQTSVYDLR